MSETDEFQQSLADLEEAMKNGLRSFAQWFEKEWQYKSLEEWEMAFDEPYPGDVWVEGYNAGVRSVLVALDYFLDDHY